MKSGYCHSIPFNRYYESWLINDIAKKYSHSDHIVSSKKEELHGLHGIDSIDKGRIQNR